METKNTILIVNNANKGIHDFTRPLEKILDTQSVKWHTIEFEALPMTDVDNYGACIMSASPMGNDIVDNHQQYYQWLKTTTIAVFGICAGHQITGKLFGATLIRDREMESGDFNVDIVADDPIFSDYNKNFIAKQQHHDSVGYSGDTDPSFR